MKSITLKELRKCIICHFAFWDVPATALVEIDGVKYWAKAEGGRYRLFRIAWDEVCDEYLSDYRAAYHHCFYADGNRPTYDGRGLGAFLEKYGHVNEIEIRVIKETASC